MTKELQLSSTERAELTLTLGSSRAARLFEAADSRLTRPPKGELTGRQDPQVQTTGRYYTQIEDPRKGVLTRLDPVTLERLALDGQVKAGLEIIKLPILTLRPEVVHPEPEVREFLQHEFDRNRLRLMRNILRALEFGFAAAEKVFTYKDTTIQRRGRTLWSGNAVVYEKLKWMHPAAIELITGERGEGLGFKQTSGGRADVPEDKALIYTHDEQFGNRYGNPRTRAAYKYWWWQQLLYQFSNRYMEDQAIPQRKVFYEPDLRVSDPNNPESAYVDLALADALRVAEDSRAGSAIAFPLQEVQNGESLSYQKGWDMEYLTGPQKAGEFITLLDHYDFKKLRAMFVPEKLIASGQGGGSFAMVESLADFFLMSEEALAAEMLEFIAASWARPLIDYNFGSSVVDASFAPVKLSQGNKSFLQDFFKQFLGQVLMYNPGALKVDTEALAKELGVPVLASEIGDGVTAQGAGSDQPGHAAAAPAAIQATAKVPKVHTFDLDVPGVRKATHGREWETQTKAFQELLGELYETWSKGTAKALADVIDVERPAVLESRLRQLQKLALTAYREAIPAGYTLGLGPTPTPDSLATLAERLKLLEEGLARTIATVGQKIATDLPGATASELHGLIQVRMGYVTKQGGGDYWATIVEGWVDKRMQREEDPDVTHGRIRWVLDNLASHCPDCPRHAGVYASIRDLPAIPGDGKTQCGIYCRCWLEEEDANGNWVRRIHDL
ncbi:phage portal protein family protein [Deinococcus peraridilitoris]|uniref:Portal protein n=1 Tax=Deinococcus peraridilitoris (strain DSM 19664 / LMG 22246 / CIP 109416 / KR-200) TaxID=937777 RepID=K9ZZC5_DEIPD|nr:hypothetical protein [Deinococcus peraridilitoris]AFZ66998.1 hypothetical protein Deipe_1457 [Deinococcus peraridilitoris DSM 19664]